MFFFRNKRIKKDVIDKVAEKLIYELDYKIKEEIVKKVALFILTKITDSEYLKYHSHWDIQNSVSDRITDAIIKKYSEEIVNDVYDENSIKQIIKANLAEKLNKSLNGSQ